MAAPNNVLTNPCITLFRVFQKWNEDCGNVCSSCLLNMMIKDVTVLIIGAVVKHINKMS
jgi:hypothetical protein